MLMNSVLRCCNPKAVDIGVVAKRQDPGVWDDIWKQVMGPEDNAIVLLGRRRDSCRAGTVGFWWEAVI